MSVIVSACVRVTDRLFRFPPLRQCVRALRRPSFMSLVSETTHPLTTLVRARKIVKCMGREARVQHDCVQVLGAQTNAVLAIPDLDCE